MAALAYFRPRTVLAKRTLKVHVIAVGLGLSQSTLIWLVYPEIVLPLVAGGYTAAMYYSLVEKDTRLPVTRIYMTLFLLGWSVFLLFSDSGIPREILQRKSVQLLSDGYVIGVDDTSLTFVYSDGGLRRIPNDDIGGRFVCPAREPSGLQLLFGWDSIRDTAPAECALPSVTTPIDPAESARRD